MARQASRIPQCARPLTVVGRMPFRPVWCLAIIAAPILTASSRVVRAQSAATQARLDTISARGRALAGYQRAALLASTQLMATNPDPWKVQRYVAYHADSGWVVAFGRLSTQRDTFYVSHIAIPAAISGQRVDSLFEFQTFADPAPDTDFLVRGARAMDMGVMTLGVTERSYAAAASPVEEGEWWVYLTPAANAASVWPLGDDVRYRVSADGFRVLGTHRMHVGMVSGAAGTRTDGTRVAASWHRTTVHDLPEDSDVFHVLARRPQVPEIVVTRHHQYVVGVDGSIKYAQKKEMVVGVAR